MIFNPLQVPNITFKYINRQENIIHFYLCERKYLSKHGKRQTIKHFINALSIYTVKKIGNECVLNLKLL